ncbi:hypothetical protein Lser_V15G40922 [Lactuca serriola]
MAPLSLELYCTLMSDRRSGPTVGLTVRNKVLPHALTLVKRSLLQGKALSALQNFFATLLYSTNTSFDALLESLISTTKPSPQSGGIAKQALFSISQCVVVLCLAAGDHKCSPTVQMLIDILKDDSTSNFVIVRQSVDNAKFKDSSIEKILNLLFNHCESEEEGVRNVLVECLGKIALIKPSKLVPALKHVRLAVVLALSLAVHNMPNVIKGLLLELLPLLYDQTVIKKQLIRTVDLGPFKHIVDDGLELRKAAFECVVTLLDSCLDQLNPSSFIISLKWKTPPQTMLILTKPNSTSVKILCEKRSMNIFVEPQVRKELLEESSYFNFAQSWIDGLVDVYSVKKVTWDVV